MKGLVSKKHDYLGKLNRNKKQIQGLRKYLETIGQLLYETVKLNKSSPNLSPSDVKSIEENIKLISTELEGSEEKILSNSMRIDSSSPRYKKDLFSSRLTSNSPKQNNEKLTIDEILRTKREEKEKSIATGANTAQAVILPRLGDMNAVNSSNDKLKKTKKQYDYNYIVLRNKSTSTRAGQESSNYNPQFKKRSNRGNSVNMNNANNKSSGGSRSASREYDKRPETLVINDWDPILEDVDTYLDYDQTSEFEYKKILKKTEHLMILKEKVEKGLKEKEKIYEKKFRDIESTIKENQKKLGVFKQV